jgi:hypothetical protein
MVLRFPGFRERVGMREELKWNRECHEGLFVPPVPRQL